MEEEAYVTITDDPVNMDSLCAEKSGKRTARRSKDKRIVPPVKIKLMKRKKPSDELAVSDDEFEQMLAAHDAMAVEDPKTTPAFVVEAVQPLKRSDRVAKKSKKSTEAASSARLLEEYDFSAEASTRTGGTAVSPVDPTFGGASSSPVTDNNAITTQLSSKKSRRINRSPAKTRPFTAEPDFVNNEYCEVCRFGGEIILCDTCPRSYHLVCLDPELDAVPEGQWSCPKCVREGRDPNHPLVGLAGGDTAPSKVIGAALHSGNRCDYDDVPERRESIAGASDHHMESCKECKQVGELLCCDVCPLAYHLHCLVPPLKEIPDGRWECPRCTCEVLPGKIQKILTWRWRELIQEEDQEDVDMPTTEIKSTTSEEILSTAVDSASSAPDHAAPQRVDCDELVADTKFASNSSSAFTFTPVALVANSSLANPAVASNLVTLERSKHILAAAGIPDGVALAATVKQHRVREFFIKWESFSYWRCSWVTQMQMEVHSPQMLRSYMRKVDMSEPPPCEEFPDDRRGEHRKELEIEERFLRYGIKPEWLEVQRILNHRVDKRDGSVEFLCKWRELGYDQATWEFEENEIPDFQQHVDYYVELRSAYDASMGKRPLKKLLKRRKGESRFRLPSEKPSTNLHTKWVEQPAFVNENGNTLHEYQLEGINWLRHSWANETNVILADEMGLGKTIQEGHSKGPFLVSVPLSTLVNWEREFELWAPDFYVLSYIGDRESRAVMREHEFSFEENVIRAGPKACRMRKPSSEAPVKFHVLLTSYEMVCMDQALLSSIQWKVLVVDEAHRLKSNQSKFFRTLSQYAIDYKVLLTGTPLQNTLEELFHLLNFMDSRKFSQMNAFLNEFADIAKEEQIQKLHELLGTHMLRRLKADVLKNMPSKRELIVRVELSQLQKRFYKAVLTRNFDTLSHRGSGQCSLLNIVMDLKKVCNHPYLFPAGSAEAPRLMNHAYEGTALIQASGKLILLSEMLRKLKNAGHRVLIFSQMTRMLDLLEDFCDHEGYRYERLDGSVTGSVRQEAIDRFNAPGAQQFVFLLSTRAGGLGINLATADTVIIYDSDWNPHNDIQAFSRAHRLGQANKVMIYRFVTRGSVEERVTQVAKRKMMLTHLVVRPGMGGSSRQQSFSKKDLDDILRFGTTELFKDDAEMAKVVAAGATAAALPAPQSVADGMATMDVTVPPSSADNPNAPWTRKTTALESQEIHYDDEAIAALLDRDQGVEVGATAAPAGESGEGEQSVMGLNEYLDSFKVATYSLRQGPVNDLITTEPVGARDNIASTSINAVASLVGGNDADVLTDTDMEVLRQEATENQDPNFWEKLLRHHYEHNREEAAQRMGRGKRERKQVRYIAEDARNNALGVTSSSAGDQHQQQFSDYEDPMSSSSDDDGEARGGDCGGGAGGRRSQRVLKGGGFARDEKLPPMLARVKGSIEVFGFNARQRKAYLNAVLRFGLPPPDAYEKQWLVKDLRTKSQQSFSAYTRMFLRHLCEPGADHGECFSDGVPREGISRPLVLQRIGVMSLVRKKVKEFEGVNGTHSLPDLAEQLVIEKRLLEQRARDDKLAARKEKTLAGIALSASTTTDPSGFVGGAALSAGGAKQGDTTVNLVFTVPGVDSGEGVAPDIPGSRERRSASLAQMETRASFGDGLESCSTKIDRPIVTIEEKARHDKRKVMFNIADAGFTELHTLWQNEERALVSHRATQPQEPEIWNKKHDYWLLSGVSKHGYARWNEICNDPSYEILNLPFRQALDYFEVKTKFIARRFKLLEQALVVEEQIRRCAYLQQHLMTESSSLLVSNYAAETDSASDPDADSANAVQLARHYSKLELISAAYQQLSRDHVSVPSASHVSNRTTASGILRVVLQQLYDLLGDLKSDVNRVPAQFNAVTPSFQKLHLSERSILNRLVSAPTLPTLNALKTDPSITVCSELDANKKTELNGENNCVAKTSISQTETKERLNIVAGSKWRAAPASFAFNVDYGVDLRKTIESRWRRNTSEVVRFEASALSPGLKHFSDEGEVGREAKAALPANNGSNIRDLLDAQRTVGSRLPALSVASLDIVGDSASFGRSEIVSDVASNYNNSSDSVGSMSLPAALNAINSYEMAADVNVGRGQSVELKLNDVLSSPLKLAECGDLDNEAQSPTRGVKNRSYFATVIVQKPEQAIRSDSVTGCSTGAFFASIDDVVLTGRQEPRTSSGETSLFDMEPRNAVATVSGTYTADATSSEQTGDGDSKGADALIL